MYTENHKDYQILFLKENDLRLKESYATEVYGLLENAYRVCGGITLGSGFQNEEDMIENIPFWRLTFKNDQLISVVMFKERKCGYKMVAYAPLSQIDSEIRSADIDYMMDNSFAELSGALLVIVLKNLGSNWKRYIQSAERTVIVKGIESLSRFCFENEIPDNSKEMYERLSKEWPELLSFCYLKKIGNEYKIKVIMGTIK